MAEGAEIDWADEAASQSQETVGFMARMHSMAAAMDAEVVTAYEASTEWAADGHRTVTAGVRHESNQSTGTARRRVQRSRKLRHLDEVAGALAAGEISVDAADLILTADRRDTHDAVIDDQKLLVEYAKELEYPDLVTVIRSWQDVRDPDDADHRANRRDDERSVHASRTLGSQVRLDGWLTPTEGAEFLAELERREKVLFEADWSEARDRLGDKATPHDLRRTPAVRRHDALIEMARRSAAYTGDGPAARGRAVVNVLMDYGTFIAELARHTGRPYGYPESRTCELADGTVITPSEALNLALAGEVRRVVFGAEGHVLEFGRSRRLFTPALAEAIGIRDRRCAHEGCLLPAAKCETDHVMEWHDGGETCERNGEPRCGFHNKWKTNNPVRWRRNRERDRERRPPPRE
jgi:hypothetical protein